MFSVGFSLIHFGSPSICCFLILCLNFSGFVCNTSTGSLAILPSITFTVCVGGQMPYVFSSLFFFFFSGNFSCRFYIVWILFLYVFYGFRLFLAFRSGSLVSFVFACANRLSCFCTLFRLLFVCQYIIIDVIN